MNVAAPHYLLFSEASSRGDSGRWHFLLRSVDGSDQFEASDIEPGVRGERLTLLTVVRALENLDQPSQVTLVGCSPFIRRGMQYGLPQWRNNGWRWECFGEMVPVKNGDLWRRMDRALRIHRVECRGRRYDETHRAAAVPSPPEPIENNENCRRRISRVMATGRTLAWRCVRKPWLLWKTWGNWLKEGTETHLHCLARTR